MTLIWVHEQPFDDWVYAIGAGIENFRDLIGPQSSLVTLPNYTGGRISKVASMGGRSFRIKTDFRPSSVGARRTDLDAIAHGLQGTVPIRFSDATDRVTNARLKSWSFVSDAGADLGRGDGTLTFDFESESGAYIAREPRFVWLSSTPVAVPLGTLPSPYILRAQGSASTPTVTWRSPLGAIKDTITFASLGSNERYELDSRTGIVTFISTSNVRFKDMAGWTAGHPPILDPRDSIPKATQHGLMSVSTGTALLIYWPVYAS